MARKSRLKQKPPSKGRPSVYNPAEHPEVARAKTAEGATLSDLAELLGVARATIQNWMQVHPAFLVAINQGRQDADDRVERALYERATGYTYDSEKIVTLSGGDGAGSMVERVPIKEHCPPDVNAQRYWLNNRRPAVWRDRQAVEHSGGVTLTLEQILAQSAAAPAQPAPEPQKGQANEE